MSEHIRDYWYRALGEIVANLSDERLSEMKSHLEQKGGGVIQIQISDKGKQREFGIYLTHLEDERLKQASAELRANRAKAGHTG
jgi:hypothetical protein